MDQSAAIQELQRQVQTLHQHDLELANLDTSGLTFQFWILLAVTVGVASVLIWAILRLEKRIKKLECMTNLHSSQAG